MVVFILFDSIVRGFQQFGVRSTGIRDAADQFPILVIFGFSQHHAFSGDEFSTRRIRMGHCNFNGGHQRRAMVCNYIATRAGSFSVETHLVENMHQHLFVPIGFFQIVLPFLAQIVVDGGLDGGAVHLDAATLGFERLEQ